MYPAFPFSRHGVILAKIVSPLTNLTPPLYAFVRQSVGNAPVVDRSADFDAKSLFSLFESSSWIYISNIGNFYE